MNFSISRKAVKLLSLVAVLILMTALFAGCKKDASSSTAPSEPELNLNLNLTPSESDTSETEPSVPETTAPVISEKSATVISQLNVRSAPSTNSASVIGTLYAGDKITVESRHEVTGVQWALISEPYSGWVCMDFVEMDIPDAPTNETATPAGQNPTTATEPDDSSSTGTTTNIKGVVTATGGLMIRSEASTNGEVKGLYNKGDVVTILETKNGWGRTNKGWIKMDYVNTSGTTTNNTTDNSNTTTTNNVTGNGNTTALLKGIVKVKELNIRSSASTNGDRLGSYTYGERVEILEKDGTWGRTSKGWISLDYVYQDGTTGTNTATGTVEANGLRVRSGPGTGYDVVGSLTNGQTVKILEQFTYNGTTWGCTSSGWVSMEYINTGSSTTTNDDDVDEGKYATITATNLRIRSGAGADYDVVGSVSKDEVVKILETKTVDGVTWGKISQGWISMAYAEYD